MKDIDSLFLRLVLAALGTLLVLVLGHGLLGCSESTVTTASLPAVRKLELELEPPRWLMVESAPDPMPAPAIQRGRDERVSWCEPLDQPFCERHSDCPGRQQCVRPWWAAVDGAKVCALNYPTKAERTARIAEIKVVVDDVCAGVRGCDPGDLLDLARALGDRESSLREDKRHRLRRDIDAAVAAWRKHKATYAGNPAIENAERWMTGLGLYGQNPALWLRRWDTAAPPETLCGVVESTTALLRSARDHVSDVEHGRIVCEGKPYFGSACEGGVCRPSWYDVSLTNSGNKCPSERTLSDFTRRARSLGLDPFGAVTQASLGRVVPFEGQDAWAESLQKKMQR